MEKNFNNIKLVALDMDGTLLDDEGEMSFSNIKAIQQVKKHGIEVVLSTGRFINEVIDFAHVIENPSYLVIANGGEIWKDFNQVIERFTIPSSLIEYLYDLALKYCVNYWGMTTENLYHTGSFPNSIHEYEWLKFGFETNNDKLRHTLWEELKTIEELEITNSSFINIEINAKGVNKARGLEYICERKNISMDNVLAIGDSLNDMAMIREAGYGIAMGNAQPAVKMEADWVTTNNVENGVAHALRYLIAEKKEML